MTWIFHGIWIRQPFFQAMSCLLFGCGSCCRNNEIIPIAPFFTTVLDSKFLSAVHLLKSAALEEWFRLTTAESQAEHGLRLQEFTNQVPLLRSLRNQNSCCRYSSSESWDGASLWSISMPCSFIAQIGSWLSEPAAASFARETVQDTAVSEAWETKNNHYKVRVLDQSRWRTCYRSAKGIDQPNNHQPFPIFPSLSPSYKIFIKIHSHRYCRRGCQEDFVDRETEAFKFFIVNLSEFQLAIVLIVIVELERAAK